VALVSNLPFGKFFWTATLPYGKTPRVRTREVAMPSTEYPYALLDRREPAAPADVVTQPVACHEITGPRAIRQRMADDFAALIRERGEDAVITVADLVALGWTRPQVLDHGTAAAALATSDEKEVA
jgi:hypothetical protein